MTKVYSADLVFANNSSMITQLESTIQTNTKLISQLQTLNLESNTNLVGSGYDIFRTNLNLYIDALQKGNIICDNLIAGIKAANNSMLNFMEGYDMLDDSKIGEIESALNAAKQFLDWLKDTHNVYDSKGNVISTERNGTDAEINQYEGIVAALSALLAKLKALAGEDKKDYQNVENVNTDILSYCNELGSKVVGSSSKYGNYTKADFESITEDELRSMDTDEYIEFLGAMARCVYDEYGGVLPSITVGQALQEAGFKKAFESGSFNIYGLIGYPSSKPKVNRLRQFDNFYEATVYHAKYFKKYSNVYSTFLDLCEQNKPIEAAGYLGAYANSSQTYGPAVQSLISSYDLTRFDP